MLMRGIIIMFLMFVCALSMICNSCRCGDVSSKVNVPTIDDNSIVLEWTVDLPPPEIPPMDMYLATGNIDQDGQEEVFVFWGNHVICIDGETGAIEWRITLNLTYPPNGDLEGRRIRIAIIENAQVIIASHEKLYGIAPRGEILWNVTLSEEILKIGIRNQTVIAITGRSIVGIRDGEILWKKQFEAYIRASASSEYNIIAVQDRDGILVMNWEGEVLAELHLGETYSEWPKDSLLITDLDRDGEAEITTILANNTVLILSTKDLTIEHKLILPSSPYKYSIATINRNNIPDVIFVLFGAKDGYDNAVAEILIWYDFNEAYTMETILFFPEPDTETFLTIWDIDKNGIGDIILGSSGYQEMNIILNARRQLVGIFHGFDIISHWFDSIYIIEGTNTTFPDIILSEHGPAMVSLIDGERIVENNHTIVREQIENLTPPILIKDIDRDQHLEIIGYSYMNGSKIAMWKIYGRWKSCVGASWGTMFNQINHDEDLDFLTDYLESIVGTDMNDRDTDEDGAPDGWEYMNKLTRILKDSGLIHTVTNITAQYFYWSGIGVTPQSTIFSLREEEPYGLHAFKPNLSDASSWASIIYAMNMPGVFIWDFPGLHFVLRGYVYTGFHGSISSYKPLSGPYTLVWCYMWILQ